MGAHPDTSSSTSARYMENSIVSPCSICRHPTTERMRRHRFLGKCAGRRPGAAYRSLAKVAVQRRSALIHERHFALIIDGQESVGPALVLLCLLLGPVHLVERHAAPGAWGAGAPSPSARFRHSRQLSRSIRPFFEPFLRKSVLHKVLSDAAAVARSARRIAPAV